MAEGPGSQAASESTYQCELAPGEISLMRDQRVAFPDPQDQEKSAIYGAIRCKDLDQVRKLLDAGLDPNTSLSGAGLTYWAAIAGSIPVLTLLLERGGNIDGVEGNFDPSPLEGAISHTLLADDWSVYEFLLAQGADPEIRSGNPTFTAAEELTITAEFDKIDELLDRGYDRDLALLRSLVERRIEVTPDEKKEAGMRLLDRLSGAMNSEDGTPR